MRTEAATGQGSREAVAFPNGNRASLALMSPGQPVADVLARLGIGGPPAVVLVFGSGEDFEPDVASQLHQLLSRGLIRAALERRAVVIDGGTRAGVMSVLGEAVAERDAAPVLLGVAPVGKVARPGSPRQEDAVPLEPNHSHFILADANEWGGETGTLFDVADALAAEAAVVAVVAGGGSVSTQEVLHAVRRGWPVVAIQGTGGVADRLAAGLAHRRQGSSAGPTARAEAEILAEGDLHVFPLDGDPAVLDRVLGRLLGGDETLRLAWQRFAELDHEAGRMQRNFRREQAAILGIGVVATLLALVQTEIRGIPGVSRLDAALRYVIIIAPIAISALIAASGRFRTGDRWVLLRGAAESIKQEIYRYRARSGIYSAEQTRRIPREVKLATKVGAITNALAQSEVNVSALRPYRGPLPPAHVVQRSDDGFGRLFPDQYVAVRLVDQLSYYQSKSVRLDRLVRRLRWAVLVVGGAGTFLAAIGLELWIALTTAVVAAVLAHLEYMRIEDTLRQFNRAAAELGTVHGWWIALPPEVQARQESVDRLVERSERVMRTEQSKWVQEMLDAMAELRVQQSQSSREGDGGGRHGREERS